MSNHASWRLVIDVWYTMKPPKYNPSTAALLAVPLILLGVPCLCFCRFLLQLFITVPDILLSVYFINNMIFELIVQLWPFCFLNPLFCYDIWQRLFCAKSYAKPWSIRMRTVSDGSIMVLIGGVALFALVSFILFVGSNCELKNVSFFIGFLLHLDMWNNNSFLAWNLK